MVRYRAVRRRLRFLVVALALAPVLGYLIVGGSPSGLIVGYVNANESAAIATLKNISSGQSQLQASGALDVNGNGQGEYGFFAELAGAAPLRGTKVPLSQPVLSESFGNVVGGRVKRGGYWFQMFLPHTADGWTTELPAGGGGPEVAADGAESLWICYAWPVERGKTGNRAFFISQMGCVTTTNMANEVYAGGRAPLAGLSAFAVDGSKHVHAANSPDKRGNIWVVM